ncbi:hypothetical protein AB0B01_14005 [Streptomyces sp. NPDC044571]|uniref:hypothetical protein n=1 Tax=Streptomyces sp. NPDC044571 TaxID=3155371 RepID=UPI0033D186E3
MLRTPPTAGADREVRRLRLPVRLRMPRIAASGVVAFLLALLSSAPAPASATAEPAPASAAAAPAQGPSVQGPSESITLKDPRIVAHFDFAAGQTPENIALEPDGSANLTFSFARQVARVDPNGDTRIIAELPAVADPQTPLVGAAVVSGIVRTHDGTLYVAYNTGTAETGIYRITADSTVAKFAALNAGSELALVRRDGTHTVLLTAQDGLSNPTSVAVRHHKVYVPSASYTAERPDPNLLIARITDAEKDGKDGPGRGEHEGRADHEARDDRG